MRSTSKTSVLRFKAGSPQYVVAHARWQQSRGRRPSTALFYHGIVIANPIKALQKALELLEVVQHHAPPDLLLEYLAQDMCLIAQKDLCRVVSSYEQVALVATPLSTPDSLIQAFHDYFRS